MRGMSTESPSMDDIQAKVRKILAANLSVPEDSISMDSRFQEDLDADSLDLVEAVLALEEEFNVTIPEEEMEGVKTVGEAITVVLAKMGAA